MSKNLISINKSPEHVELIKKMAEKTDVGMKARESFAAAMSQAVLTVLEQAPVLSNLFDRVSYDAGSKPSIPLDQYFDVTDYNYIPVWSQSVPGGLATSQTHALQEMMVATYNLNSAISFEQHWLRGGRVDVVARGMERMAAEVLRKQILNSASVIFKALADARYKSASGTDTPHIIRSNATRQIVLDDFNRLLTLAARVNSSWAGGTPIGSSNRVTDVFLSPEAMERIRAMAYNPLNTVGDKSNIPGTESFRNDVFKSGGVNNLYGININVYNEMGVDQLFNKVFAEYIGSTTFDGYGTGSATSFVQGSEELILAVDNSRNSLIQLAERDVDTNSTWNVYPDDQFVARQKKIGFYGNLTEGRVIIDARSLFGLVW